MLSSNALALSSMCGELKHYRWGLHGNSMMLNSTGSVRLEWR